MPPRSRCWGGRPDLDGDKTVGIHLNGDEETILAVDTSPDCFRTRRGAHRDGDICIVGVAAVRFGRLAEG